MRFSCCEATSQEAVNCIKELENLPIKTGNSLLDYGLREGLIYYHPNAVYMATMLGNLKLQKI